MCVFIPEKGCLQKRLGRWLIFFAIFWISNKHLDVTFSGHHRQGASNEQLILFLLFFYVLLFVLTKRVNGLEFECFVVDRLFLHS